MPHPSHVIARFAVAMIKEFDGRSRTVAQRQFDAATGDAREAWSAVLSRLTAIETASQEER